MYISIYKKKIYVYIYIYYYYTIKMSISMPTSFISSTIFSHFLEEQSCSIIYYIIILH